ncbi:hypothetical protein [Micromonospora sp. WP24]|uniref:hypothetical protein n=1 Tax=Micromonospora sp. WP24 TaxID=2604469 RepID=UPI002103C7A8|nr:hypothetical protein [Micromonospora sp. WP24]
MRESSTEHLLAWKVGITNDLVGRSQSLWYGNRRRLKFGHVFKLYNQDGGLIRNLESALLGDLRRRKACPFLPKERMPLGYSETVDPSAVSLEEIRIFIRVWLIQSGKQAVDAGLSL